MSLTALSRYDDAEDEIKDEDHDLITKPVSDVQKDSGEESQSGSEIVSRPPSVLENKPKSLVSYIGGEYSDDENTSDEESNDGVSTNKASVVNLGLFDGSAIITSAQSNSPAEPQTETTTENVKETTDSIQLPPEPEGRCSKSIQEKVTAMIEKKRKGFDVNEYIQRKKEFRNPSIYEKLVSFMAIDEHGTNFPRHLYDPTIWGPDSYYDALAKAQKEHHEKKEKEKLKRTHVEFVKGTKPTSAPPVSNPEKKSGNEKKSKWDQKIPPALQKVMKS